MKKFLCFLLCACMSAGFLYAGTAGEGVRDPRGLRLKWQPTEKIHQALPQVAKTTTAVKVGRLQQNARFIREQVAKSPSQRKVRANTNEEALPMYNYVVETYIVTTSYFLDDGSVGVYVVDEESGVGAEIWIYPTTYSAIEGTYSLPASEWDVVITNVSANEYVTITGGTMSITTNADATISVVIEAVTENAEYIFTYNGAAVEIPAPTETEDPVVTPTDSTIVASGSCGTNATYVLTSDGVLTISGTGIVTGDSFYNYSSQIKELVIEEGITGIEAGAFEELSNITSVVLPSTVTYLNYWAFGYCQNLKSVTLNEGLTTIYANAFIYCYALEYIYIPSTVSEISGLAFQWCTSLTTIEAAADSPYLSSIDGVLFNKDQTKLIIFPAGKSATTYIIPETVTEVGDYAFWSCQYVNEVIISKNVETIGDGVFMDSEITIAANNVNFVTIDGVLFNKDQTVLLLYPSNKEDATYVIPEGTTTIAAEAFSFNEHLQTLVIPASVTTIGYRNFVGSSSLTSIISYMTELPTMDSSCFESVTLSSITLTVPEGTKALYAAADYWGEMNIVEDGEAEPVEPVYSTVKVRFKTDWSSVYVYAWDADGNQLEGGWPGTKIDATNDWYIYNLQRGANIIFNSGLSGSQTQDIQNVTTDVCYVWSNTEKKAVLDENCDGEIDDDQPIVVATYTVAGSPKEVFGTFWNTTDTDNDMTYNNGIYTWTKQAVELEANTTIEFKIVENHSWEVSYGKDYYGDGYYSNVTYTIGQDGVYDITITFNPKTLEITIEVVPTEVVSPVLTVAEALAIIEPLEDPATTDEEYTVEGYVTSIDVEYDERFDNISFYIADTKDETEKVLLLYRVKPQNTSDIEVTVGDKVQFTGYLQKYKQIAETKTGGKYTIIEKDDTKRYYTITFLNEDGSVVESKDWLEGETPTCAEPTKDDDEYIYCFAGWEPEIVPATENAIYTATYEVCGGWLTGDVYWRLQGDTLVVAGLGGYIPDYSPNNPAPWARYSGKIHVIYIDDTISRIGEYAFHNLSGVHTVRVPQGLAVSGAYSFLGCTSIRDVYFTGYDYEWAVINFVNEYSNPLRYGAALNEKKITIHADVTEVSTAAFVGMETVYYEGTIEDWVTITFTSDYVPSYDLYIDGKKVTDPCFSEGMTMIGQYTFCGCTSIQSVCIPSTMREIGKDAFARTPNLSKVIYYGTIEQWCQIQFANTEANPAYNASSLIIADANVYSTGVTIPASVATIRPYAFATTAALNVTFQSLTASGYMIESFGSPTYSGARHFEVPCGMTEAYMAQIGYTANNYTEVYPYNYQLQVNDEKMGYINLLHAPDCDDETLVIEAVANEQYRFVSWSDGAQDAVRQLRLYSDTTITATFELDAYLITFVRDDGTLILSDYFQVGTMPEIETPTKEATAQYSYTFDHFEPELTIVTEPATYTAYFNQTVNVYHVWFQNPDSTILYEQELEYGSVPQYRGAIPEQEPTAQYSYVFMGWDKPLSAVTGDTYYTAQYMEILNTYSVFFLDWDGAVLSEQTIGYGMAAVAPQVGEREHYVFNGWSADINYITSRTFAVAQYEREVEGGTTVYYVSEDNIVLYTETVLLTPPQAPQIDKKSFAAWLTNDGYLEDGIVIRAMYIDDEPTGIDAQVHNAPRRARKVLENGIVYIITPDGKRYTTLGQER